MTSITILSLLLFSGFYISNGFNGSEKNSLVLEKNHYAESSFLSAVGETNKEFVVGAIIPFTGSFSSIGKPIKVALEKAEYDVNKYFEKMNYSSRFNLVMANSKTDPNDSLEAIKQLHSLGAKIIVGPATSTAVSAVKEYADTNNIIF
jgi:branched-chain amino acid transport system substrate-binding protein